jgi:hypothetical protein|nr:ankyrin repeat domain-containing protein [Neorhizobium tomejilense]
MTITSLDRLIERVCVVTSGKSAEEAVKDMARRERVRVAYETKAAVYAMFTLARMTCLIDGFPLYVQSLGLRFDGSKWNCEVTQPGVLFFVGQENVIRSALPSMGIGDVKGAAEVIVKAVGWELSTLGQDLVAASHFLPIHTVEAFFSMGLHDIANMIGCMAKDLPAEQIAASALKLGVDFTKSSDGGSNLLARLTNPISLPYLKALIRMGVKPDCSTLIASASYYDLEVFDTLLDTGLSLDSTGDKGETALHVAVLNATVPHCEEAIAFARGLLQRGIDRDIKDNAGKTAASLLRERIDDIYGRGEENRYDMMLVEELHGML